LIIIATKPGAIDLLGLGIGGAATIEDYADYGPVFADDKANNNFTSGPLFPVDPKKTYDISGYFKSVAGRRSNLYLGIIPYDQTGAFISDVEGNRSRNAVSIDFVVPGNQINTAEDMVDWPASGAVGYSRFLGFYYDGDTTHRPDFLLVNPLASSEAADSSGAFQPVTNPRMLTLNIPIPTAVIAKINRATKIMVHNSAGTFQYVTAQGGFVPEEEFSVLSGQITGEAFENGAGQSTRNFRVGTRYARLCVLTNYYPGDGNTPKILFDDLRVIER